MTSEELPTAIKALRPLVQSHFARSDLRSSLMTDILTLASHDDLTFTWDETEKTKHLTPAVYLLMLSNIGIPLEPGHSYHPDIEPVGQERKRLVLNGVVYRKFVPSAHKFRGEGDSSIQFTRGGTLSCGRIIDMFVHGGKAALTPTFFLVVQVFGELNEVQSRGDPYRQYPLLQVRLCLTQIVDTVVIRAHDILSHVASCHYIDGLQVVVSLDRSGELTQ